MLTSAGDVSGTFTVPAAVTYDNTVYTVTAVGQRAFADCRSLEALLIPGSVTEVGRETARGCTSLKIVELGDGLSQLGDEAFTGCTALEKVVLSDLLTEVPRRCFFGDAALQEVYLGKGTAAVGTQAFDGCAALVSVVCMAAEPPSTGAYAFDPAVLKAAVLTVPGGCRAAYAAKPVWGDFRSIVENNYGTATVPFHLYLPSGRVTSRERLGSALTLAITAPPGWEVQSLTLDGADVTSQLTAEGYITVGPLTSETTLAVAVRDVSGITGVSEPLPNPRRVAGGIEMRGVPHGTHVTVSTLDGIVLFDGPAQEFLPVDAARPVMVVIVNQKFIL